MERNFNNEFERFLKESADQYRLYPSSKVWTGIHTALHTRRKWFGLGIVLLLITGSLVTLLITNSSKETVITVNKPSIENGQTPASNIPARVGDKRISGNTIKDNTLAFVGVKNNEVENANSRLSQTDDAVPVAETTNLFSDPTNNLEPLAINLTDELTDQDFFNTQTAERTFSYPKHLQDNPFDLTIESVLNSYHKRSRRLSFQFSFTPTISYRKLSANKSFLRSAALQANIPYTYAALYDINSAVTHKPDMGLELGWTAKYALTKNFKVKAGLQVNVNRYDIKSFNYPSEVTTIALKREGGSGVDSIRTISSHRNFNGYSSDWLQNFYFQISIPVGIEVNLIGDDKVQFGVAGTIQPTYILGDRAYLLSTDYKNYVQVPWLIRRWNANTALETYVSYSTGRMKWQVGPQVRYQLLSSFVDKYPVKENLFDFGLKVGISLNK